MERLRQSAGMTTIADFCEAIDHYGIDMPLYVLGYSCTHSDDGSYIVQMECMRGHCVDDEPMVLLGRPRLRDMARVIDTATKHVGTYVHSFVWEPLKAAKSADGDYCRLNIYLWEYQKLSPEEEPDDGKQPPVLYDERPAA